LFKSGSTKRLPLLNAGFATKLSPSWGRNPPPLPKKLRIPKAYFCVSRSLSLIPIETVESIPYPLVLMLSLYIFQSNIFSSQISSPKFFYISLLRTRHVTSKCKTGYVRRSQSIYFETRTKITSMHKWAVLENINAL
jgi:hypothetical protein